MASGVQTLTALSATTYTQIAAGPSSGRAQVLSVSMCNTGIATRIHLAVCPSGTSTPASTDFIEYNAYVSANGVLERTGIVLGTGQILIAYAVSAAISVAVYGVEDVAVAATGVMGRYSLSAATDTQITTTPSSGRYQAMTVNFCNTNNAAVTVRLGVSTTPTSMSAGNYLEYELSLPAYGVLERTGIIVSNGYAIGARASTTGVAVVAWGIDQAV